MEIKKHFTDHMIVYLLVPMVLGAVFMSYYRFVIKNDYIVSYEAECDPYSENCFIGCEDDECTETYFYSMVQKNAIDLYEICGQDITDCDSANVCLPSDRDCTITYCELNVEGDTCEILTEESRVTVDDESEEDNQTES